MRLICAGIEANGRPYAKYENNEFSGERYQPPFLAAGLRRAMSISPNEALVSEVYPAMDRHLRHWIDNFTTEATGLIHYPQATGMDDSRR